MATVASWAIELLDRVTAPGARIDRMLSRIETRIVSTTASTRSLVGGFNSLTAAGENSARRISSAWNGVSRSISSSQQNMQSLVGSMTLAAAGVAGVGYAGKKILDAAGMRESNLSQIAFLLRTNDKAKIGSAANWINKFADITPFSDQQTIKAVRQTMSYGFSWDQMKGLNMVTGDAASIVGDNPDDAAYRWSMILRAFGQIKSKGRLQQEELNQLQEHGIGANRYVDAAFGPNRQKLQAAGQISASAAIMALIKGMHQDFGGGMIKQSQTLFGLASTLKSRPQRIFGTLADGGLDDLKRLFKNLINLSDFEKDPGKRVLKRLSESGNKLTKALFGPLADGTQGAAAEQNIDRMLAKLDEFSAWWTTNGPRVGKELNGFADGFKSAGEGAAAMIKPLVWIGSTVDKLSGGSGEGMLGKILGFGAGAVILGRFANFLSFGALGKMGGKAGQALLGGVSKAWTNSAWQRMMFMRSVRGAGWLRALGIAELGTKISAAVTAGGGLGALAVTGARAIPVIGWIITGVTALKMAGDGLYERWSGFADLLDRIRNSMSWMVKPGSEQTSVFARALHFDPVKMIMGQKQVWEVGSERFVSETNAMAGRLGISPTDLLKIMNFESGLDPAARNRKSGATGLIQFLSGTAEEMGTSTRALGRMTREEQLPYVEEYLRRHGVRPGMGLEQLYMSVLRGNPTTGALWSRGSLEYSQNAGLDVDKNGVITSTEATAKVNAAWQRDIPRIQQTLSINVSGSVNPAAVAAIQAAANQGALNALGSIGSEGGY